MTTVLLARLAHLLVFVYWLGADLGTYYASRSVADRSLTPAQRATAARIMLGVDLAPRVCMPLALATGVQLASMLGLLVWPAPALIAVWILCLGWLAMAIAVHVGHGRSWVPGLTRFDFGFRVAALVGLLGGAAFAPWPGWLAIKVAAFATTIACGLAIRVQLRSFGPAFAALMRDGPTEATDATIARSIAGCRPWVHAIWALLLLCAATGLHLVGG